jgi:hypothetical protein
LNVAGTDAQPVNRAFLAKPRLRHVDVFDDLLCIRSFCWDDVTVAVWISYDNPDGKRRTLSRGSVRGRQAGVDVLSRVM